MTEEASIEPDDWISSATDSIIDVVDKARARGTENAIRAARVLVFGLVALVFGVAAIVMTVTIIVRLADAYLPIGAGVGDATWAAHLFIGGLLAILGFGLWASRKTAHMRRFHLVVGLDALIVTVIVCYALIERFS